MQCQRCGADIPKGEVFCFECGEEIQLVPDYNSVEYMIQQKQAMEEIELRKEQERQRKQARQEKREAEQKRKKKQKLIIITVVSLVFIIALAVGAVFFIRYRQDHSFEYQYTKAYEMYEAEDYITAEAYADNALKLSPNNDNAMLLMAEIQIHMQDIDTAAEILLSYIEKHPESVDAYARLISVYEQEQRLADIAALMQACRNDNVLTQFADYVPVEMRIVTEPGEYTSKTMVEVEYSGGTVYYTTDGTDPSNISSKYSEPILLEEGTTAFKFIAYSPKGIPGETVEAVYTVTYARPNAPFISPVSGDYDPGSEITVVVPDGCTAYYAFDSIATRSGKKYNGPVEMPEGEHIFSVIVVDENGKESYPASETYVVEE